CPGLTITRQGFVDNLAPAGGTSARYNVALNVVGRPPLVFDGTRDVVFAADGTAYAATVDRLLKISRDGVVVNSAPLVELASIDLAADQCTLVYAQQSLFTNDKLVGQFDVCRWSELPLLFRNNRDVYSVRIAPDKTILAGTIDGVTRLQPGGGVLALIPTPSRHLALSPDGTFLWAAGDATITRVDLAANAVFVEAPITIYGDTRIDALHVYGEWTAARGAATYADDPAITSVDGLLGAAGATVIVHGRGFVEGASVTLNGTAVVAAVVNTTTLRFTMPPGSFTNPTLIVTNPAGPSATFSVRVGKRRAS
ncbi:MAG TPA: IPT/TIG domain-containing protein, partial [Thermoanaerobaculia bacterium]|nr:IPT/TIG domain-containing protein [Thermoanaerobaculia bacterium]